MKERRHGRIINIGSEVIDSTPAGMSAYTAAKCAQLGLARTWARELGPFNINVNTVAPGWIPVERHAEVSSDERASYEATVPLGRMGHPSDIANAVSFLPGDSAGFLTGTKITVNGGVTVD